MIDDDRDRIKNKGKLTPQKRATIQLMNQTYGATAEAIASQLQIDVLIVQAVLNEIESSPKI
ncbi:hypothetical protein HFO55_34750 [Rhizobium leguminosarum]|uniref:hypothetical protein n=2 Tax=Rhizobium/Agrobacterium group TaxID=227290 RepID=UPI001C94E740|nr:hypothetical protein [Rhizobium leguminosarum]MBY5572257.1 hypothetical protein [Rhizobium leguminosarum]MBY5578931.1 hypothetical protein [Rhizobium leguminosarum]